MAVLTEEREPSVRDWVLAREPGTCFMSSEVPAKPEIAAVTLSRLAGCGGPIVRARRGIYWRRSPDILFTSRSNPHPILLAPVEVAVLEGVRDFDRHSEVSWSLARRRIRRLAKDGHVELDAIAAVAAHERCAGLPERMTELLTA